MKKILEYYEKEDDQYTSFSPDDTRKVHLTLKHINLLRKRRELQKYEDQIRKERLQQIYGNGDDEMGGGELTL